MTDNMTSPEVATPNPEAFHTLSNPDFDAGNVVAYFASEGKGLQVITDQTFRRTDGPLKLTTDEKTSLKGAYAGEMRFTKGNEALDALNALRAERELQTQDPSKKDQAKLQALEEGYEKARSYYVNEGTKVKVELAKLDEMEIL